jgi:hypothetical protein
VKSSAVPLSTFGDRAMGDPCTIDFQLGGTLRFRSARAKSTGHAIVTIRYDGFSVTAHQREDGNMAYTLPNDHTVKVQISYVDSHGNPAAVDGPVAWASSNEDVLTVEVDPADSTMVTIWPEGQVSQAQVVATADADLGEGIRQIVTTMDVTVVAGEAVSGTIAPIGPPTPIA